MVWIQLEAPLAGRLRDRPPISCLLVAGSRSGKRAELEIVPTFAAPSIRFCFFLTRVRTVRLPTPKVPIPRRRQFRGPRRTDTATLHPGNGDAVVAGLADRPHRLDAGVEQYVDLQLPLGGRHCHCQSGSDHGLDPVDQVFELYRRLFFGLRPPSSPLFSVRILERAISVRVRFEVNANVLDLFGFTMTRLGGLIVQSSREGRLLHRGNELAGGGTRALGGLATLGENVSLR